MSEKKKNPPVIGTLSGVRGDELDEETGTGHPEMFVLPSSGPHGTQRLDVGMVVPRSRRGSDIAPKGQTAHGGDDDDLATRVVDPGSLKLPARPGAPSVPGQPAAQPVAHAPVQAPAPAPAASIGTRRKAVRRTLAIEAVVTTPKGERHVLQTIDASSRGLLVGSMQQQLDVRPGWTCQVLLVHGTMTVDFDAEVVRVVDPSEAPGFASAFALQVVMLTRDQQTRLHAVLSSAMEAGSSSPLPGIAVSSQAIRVTLFAALFTVVLGLLGAGGYALYASRQRVTVNVTRVTRAPIDDVATSLPPGEIIAAQRVTVRSTLPGPKIVRLEVSQGQRVRAGDVLARARDSSLEDSIAHAHDRASSAEAAYRRARDEAAAMRNRNLPGTDISESEDALARARAQMVASRQAFDGATAELKRNQIEAPFDGLVAELLVHNGELLEPAAPVCDLIDDTVFRARVNFPEAAASRMQTGGNASVWIPGATSPIEATIDKIGEVVHSGPEGARVVPVELKFPPKVEPRVGSSARAEVVLEHKELALCVPTSCLQGSGEVRQVYVLGKNDHVEQRSVSVGLVQTDLAEIVSGLDEGEKVVVSPPPTLLPNARVLPHEMR